MASVKGGLLVKGSNNAIQAAAKANVAAMLNSYLDRDGFKRRFDELLGARAPQFVSSMVALINADDNLKQCFNDAPITIIQSCLKAATYDLPIDPSLGYAYIVPFRNKDKNTNAYKYEATFIMGYKGMHQLACRSGVYSKINVLDVREGELKSFNRLTEDIEFEWIEDEDERNSKPIIGYCGYYRLVNGMEKTIYMSRKEIEAHEGYVISEESLDNNDEYNADFDLVRRLLMIAQRKDIHTMADLQTIVTVDATKLIEKFMDVAYTVLKNWQYDDVKYYENFIYAVLSQFSDLYQAYENKAMMDVADLYIEHGDYGLGDANYAYILRENQIKDYIYYRYAKAYEHIDYEKSRAIANEALQFVDDRYTYYPNIRQLLEN